MRPAGRGAQRRSGGRNGALQVEVVDDGAELREVLLLADAELVVGDERGLRAVELGLRRLVGGDGGLRTRKY